jgi:peptidoglycan hydrolase CwlO-like protein
MSTPSRQKAGTMGNMNKRQTLDRALKSAQTILKQYIRALVSENSNLQKQVARLYAKNVSKDHLIASLRGELQKLGRKDPSEELADRIKAARKRVAEWRGQERAAQASEKGNGD